MKRVIITVMSMCLGGLLFAGEVVYIKQQDGSVLKQEALSADNLKQRIQDKQNEIAGLQAEKAGAIEMFDSKIAQAQADLTALEAGK